MFGTALVAWSSGQVTSHLSPVDQRLLDMLQNTQPAPSPPLRCRLTLSTIALISPPP